VIRVDIKSRDAVPALTVGFLIRDRLGNDVFGTNTFHLGVSRTAVKMGETMRVDFSFPSLDLGIGSYSLTAALHSGPEHTQANFDWWDRALVFDVLPGDGPISIGVCALQVSASWQSPTSSCVTTASLSP
jgi:lipopolysaccharide transport system ATP-binding protein